MFKILVAGALLCAAAPQPAQTSAVIQIPTAPPSEAGIPLAGFMSYSIEFSSFPDYAGNLSHPNNFSNNLLNNLAVFAGTKPHIRVGGNTQDFAIFDQDQAASTIGSFNPAISEDYPSNLTFGPSYFESYETWPDVQFVHGFNLGRNSTAARRALINSVPYACKALSNGKLLHWELGNEPDLYNVTRITAVRPPTWGNDAYVEEWQKWSTAINSALIEACPDLPITYYAPSFGGTTNSLDPVKVWQLGLDSRKDIALITSHNYITGATSPGVTLQSTLMNHTTTVTSITKQLTVAHNLASLPSTQNPNLPFILGEHNSLYNQGRPGLSNTFGAALWGLDFNLYCASTNIRRVHMHMGTNYRYQSWQPISTAKESKGTKAPYYGNIAVAAFLGDGAVSVVNIPMGREEEAGYAAYVEGRLKRVVVVNMMGFNATDYNEEFVSGFPRPVVEYRMEIGREMAGGTVCLRRLSANGSDAISGVTFDGYSYNFELDEGRPVLLGNVTRGESVAVDEDGVVSVSVPWSGAVILDLQ